jgi:branched-chain amino acid transport system ATP-binding protein
VNLLEVENITKRSRGMPLPDALRAGFSHAPPDLSKAMEELEFVSLSAQAENLARNLSYGNQRLLEIARTLASEPRLIVLDEPAGGMNELETAALVSLIARIKARGITVLLIEHDMSLVMKACEHLVVLEYGKKIAEGEPDAIKENPLVIEAYLGSDDDEQF